MFAQLDTAMVDPRLNRQYRDDPKSNYFTTVASCNPFYNNILPIQFISNYNKFQILTQFDNLIDSNPNQMQQR